MSKKTNYETTQEYSNVYEKNVTSEIAEETITEVATNYAETEYVHAKIEQVAKANNTSISVSLKSTSTNNLDFITIPFELLGNISKIKVKCKYNGTPLSGRFSVGFYGSDELVEDFEEATAISLANSNYVNITNGEAEYTLTVSNLSLSYKYIYVATRVYGGSSHNTGFSYTVSDLELYVNDVKYVNYLAAKPFYTTNVEEITSELKEVEYVTKDELIDYIAGDDKVYLFGYWGQSNADGRGEDARPDYIPDTAMMIDEGTIRRGIGWTDKKNATSQYATWLSLLSGKNIAIVKTAQGGVSIGAATDPTWNSDVSGSLFDKAVSDYNVAVTTLENAGYEVVKAGFVWTQGEADYANYIDEYATNLTNLINKARAQIDENLKCFINLAGDKYDKENDTVISVEQIRDKQKSVADSVDGVYIITDCAKRFVPSDLNMLQDDWHYTDDGYRLLGKQGAEYTYKVMYNDAYNAKYEMEGDHNLLEDFYTKEEASNDIQEAIGTINVALANIVGEVE